jgi:hypothetical protein
MKVTTSLATRFNDRFRGLERAHGEYKERGTPKNGGKQQGAAQTVREPPTVELWEKHLAGELGIGIVPIRDDGTCFFGAVDVDEYTGNLADLSKQLVEMELPLILCRSKSGGAHMYLFCRESIPAELVRRKLMDWAVALGYGGVEVFPKQTRLAGENDFGNWINMPYFVQGDTARYAIYNGKKLSAEEFLDLADLMAVDTDALTEKSAPISKAVQEFFEDAPPCLQSLAQRGFGEGSRNNGLFNIGVYLRKRFGDDFWEEHLDQYNQRFMDPPLGHKEVSALVKSLKRKEYFYKCNDAPINMVCNKQICLTRKFGVGTADGDPGVVFGTLVKLETSPPMWIWDVDGARIELTTAELKDQNRFHSRAIEELNKWPLLMKPKAWSELIRDKLQNVEVQEVPPEAKPEGQMWFLLEDFCTGKAQARNREELMMGKPWTPKLDEPVEELRGRTFFSGVKFKQYLEQNRLRVDERTLWMWLRKRGALPKFFNIKGKGINCWSIPSFHEQDEDYEVPTLGDEEM